MNTSTLSRIVRSARPRTAMRQHFGGMIVVQFNGRQAVFHTGVRYRCWVNGIELDSTHAGHVGTAAQAAFAAGVSFEVEEIDTGRTDPPMGVQSAEIPALASGRTGTVSDE